MSYFRLELSPYVAWAAGCCLDLSSYFVGVAGLLGCFLDRSSDVVGGALAGPCAVIGVIRTRTLMCEQENCYLC